LRLIANIMEARAISKNIGISTKKTRIPAMIVKGMNVVDALVTLKYMRKGTAAHVAKTIKSAAANAMNKEGIEPQNLYIQEIRIDKGQSRVKHYHPRAKGGGYYMWIRGKSHISVVVTDIVAQPDEKKTKSAKKVSTKEEVKDVEVKAEKKAPKARKTVAKKAKAE
jgi:large subunit ribosomal protein L22